MYYYVHIITIIMPMVICRSALKYYLPFIYYRRITFKRIQPYINDANREAHWNIIFVLNVAER